MVDKSTSRKLILYIAMSLDGYIAQENDDLSFLSIVENGDEDYGYNTFIKDIDTIVIGRKTYDWVTKALGSYPHKDKYTYVVSSQAQKTMDNNIVYYNGSLKQLIDTLKSTPGKNIYCDGGAELAHSLFKEHLIDECIISVIPVMLGGGTALFKEGRQMQHLRLLSAKSFEKGLVQLHYKCLNDT